MKKLFIQFFKFLIISGTGWLIDTSCYLILTLVFKQNVILSNILSSIPALTFVFFVSTRKIFSTNTGKLSIKKKYLIYFLYQIILIFSVSLLGQVLYDFLMNYFIIEKGLLKILVKIIITPITMIINFFVMKFLAEKI